MLPALALGAEKPEPGVMSRPPRSRTDRLLPWWLLVRVYFCLGLMEAVAAMSAFFFVLIRRLALRAGVGPARPALPPGDDGLLRGCGAHAGGERLLVPK